MAKDLRRNYFFMLQPDDNLTYEFHMNTLCGLLLKKEPE